MNDNEIRLLMEKTQRDLLACEIIYSRHTKERCEHLLLRYGDKAIPLMESIDKLIGSFLNNSHDDLAIALSILKECWGSDVIDQLPQQMFYNYVLSSKSPEVQRLAIYCLRAHKDSINNPLINDLFARIVVNDNNSIGLREVAYEGILEISGMPSYKWPSLISTASFPNYVDWLLVKSKLRYERN